ncbi:hypothetical protein BDP27DRAFT_1361201 [Rhodocollybia butyracea]|uniref:Uncharacterized protein n=1 Tax=Rhodocollybia butyracea TaxID=206335 RepID=A0A9P5PZA1_9AGAR|nr:hypothetical protein BDP27DRAFT_1361201 [Rhodocollybia butyracea]
MSNVEDGFNSDDGGQSSHLHRQATCTEILAQAAPILMRSSSGHSIRRGLRSTSVSSTARGFRDDEAFSEAEEYGEETADSQRRSAAGKAVSVDDEPHADSSDEHEQETDETPRDDEDPITLKERQSLINVEHPFGLPIWKPAFATLYSFAQAERHLLPGNLFWVVFFGWWMSIVCCLVAAVLFIVPRGGRRYASLVFGLGWYIAWPFGKYVEGIADDVKEEEEDGDGDGEGDSESNGTIRDDTLRHHASPSWVPPTEATSLLAASLPTPAPAKSYGALSTTSSSSSIGYSKSPSSSSHLLGTIAFWLLFTSIIAPIMLVVCLICWFLVLTIPMAKLNWALIKHMFEQPETIRFCAAPLSVVVEADAEAPLPTENAQPSSDPGTGGPSKRFSLHHPRLTKGQLAPPNFPHSTPYTPVVLLCTYRASGLQYYKYTLGGVNIMFVNLLFIVFFAIFDWAVLLSWVEDLEHEGREIPPFLAAVASQGTIFVLSLLSVIPLSYFIGMAVASISAQSSIGMGAVINATFGSIIEILLYSIALVSGKGRLVEGSIVGSLLAGVLLMPGMSMMSSALRRKEVKFNAKSAGVTSMMLIMAIVGALTPTMFYQTYGNFQLVCTGCPPVGGGAGTPNKPWICDQCYYQHPDPVHDPFYQSTVKSLMYFCAAVLIFSYLIGLWFSLRTHASQIWQNPQQLLHSNDLSGSIPMHRDLANMNRTHPAHPIPPHLESQSGWREESSDAGREREEPSSPLFQRRVISRAEGSAGGGSVSPGGPGSALNAGSSAVGTAAGAGGGSGSGIGTGGSGAGSVGGGPYTPLMESVDQAVKNTSLQLPETNLKLPETMTRDDFTRAVAVATVSALRHQKYTAAAAWVRTKSREDEGVEGMEVGVGDGGGHGGHDAPSWSRFTSASVLLGCTALYAIIADEKFLGVTLLALVPNTTEFMNAISFALNGNIALRFETVLTSSFPPFPPPHPPSFLPSPHLAHSMEIGSAYALQVCLLQIPAMVAFSAWYFPDRMGEVAYTFSLIFPRWDVIALILAMFLLTYTYIEAKSNYHRGSILILSYLVLLAGFYYAPRAEDMHDEIDPHQIGLGHTNSFGGSCSSLII